MTLSERYRFLLPLSIILLVTFVSLGWINYSISEKTARSEVIDNTLPLFRDTIYANFSELFQKPILISSAISNNTFIKSWAEGGEQDAEQMIKYLAEMRLAYGFEAVFFVSAKTNVYYHYTGVHRALEKNRPEDSWYFSFLESKKDVALDINNDDIFSDELMVFTDFRVVNKQSKLLGITGVAVRFSRFSELLIKQQQSFAQRVYLVNEKGIIQVHTDRTMVERCSIEDMPGRHVVARDILSGDRESKSYDIEGDNGGIIVSTRYIPDIHWYLVVEQDESSFMQSVNQNMERTAIIGLFTTIIVLSIVLMMANRHQQRVSELAITDTLTGLVNRRGFLELFNKAKGRLGRNGQDCALAAIDLDYFKKINDKYGHHVGDDVLKAFSVRISRVLRGGDVLARWGGDEFLLLLEAGPEEVTMVLDRVRSVVESKPVTDVEGSPLFLTLSCGVTRLRTDDSIDSANKRADKALYIAKADGRGCTRFDDSFNGNL